jgi:hypothetical protein
MFQHFKLNQELPILLCVHDAESVHTMLTPAGKLRIVLDNAAASLSTMESHPLLKSLLHVKLLHVNYPSSEKKILKYPPK